MELPDHLKQAPVEIADSGEGLLSHAAIDHLLPKMGSFVWWLAMATLISRMLTTGPLYFGDGPAHVQAILNGKFVIQPPGYWLFNRTAGLFPDPELAIVILNWTFSVGGVVAFYHLANQLVRPRLARLGAVTYAAVYYVWLSGSVHSTYASQLLFPVLLFLFLVLHHRRGRFAYLLGASASLAVGAGFRPSDGVFLVPMFIYYLWRFANRRQLTICAAACGTLSLLWVLPTYLAYTRSIGLTSVVSYIKSQGAATSVLESGITLRTMANAVRYVVPLAAAFWPLSFAIFRGFAAGHRPIVRLLLWWIIPGSCFLVSFLMAPAPYLNFLTGGVVLLALITLDIMAPWKSDMLLLVCILSNVSMYLFLQPVHSKRIEVNVFNACVTRYSWYAIRNQWQPDLSELPRGIAIDACTLQLCRSPGR